MLHRFFRRLSPPGQPAPVPDKHPAISFHAELERDLAGHTLLDDALLLRWFREEYSTSKHLLTLYSLAIGLKARCIVEVGFGRSSFVLARAAVENGGRFFCCDIRDYSYLFSPQERAVTTFLHGPAPLVWNHPDVRASGVELAFLDYFSNPALDDAFVRGELKCCLGLLRQNGVVAVHDTCADAYRVGNVLRRTRWPVETEHASLPYQYGLGLLRRTGPSPFGSIPCHWVKKTAPDAILK